MHIDPRISLTDHSDAVHWGYIYMVVIIMEVVTQAKYFLFMVVQMYTFERVITLVLTVVITFVILSRG